MKNFCKITTYLSCLAALSVAAERKFDCDKYGINLYDTMGCARENTGTGRECPSYAHCNYERKAGTCRYNGIVLKDGEGIPKDADVGCNFGCICNAKNDTKGTFNCAQGQCGVWGTPLAENCYTEYKLDECCGRRKCEPSKASCEYGGRTFKEGEKIYATDECSVCLCTSKFDGKFNGENCKRRVCDAEIRHSEDIEKHCAPVYYTKPGEPALCCPYTFMCPSDDDKIQSGADASSTLTCQYGFATLKPGTIITRNLEQYGTTRSVKCECKLPPLMTCVAEL